MRQERQSAIQNPKSKIRIIDTGLADPPLTFALDEAILEARRRGLVPDTLHLYRRRRPTVSIGYFLRAAEVADLEYCRRHGVAVIRRASGGGAIYTDPRQWLFGLTTGRARFGGNVERSFAAVCGAVASAIRALGLPAEFSPPNDVTVGGRKVSGSAQVYRGDAMLHHGTVLVDADAEAMSRALKVPHAKLAVKGIASPAGRTTTLRAALGRRVAMDAVNDALVTSIAGALGGRAVRGRLTRWERREAARLVRERYARRDWNRRR